MSWWLQIRSTLLTYLHLEVWQRPLTLNYPLCWQRCKKNHFRYYFLRFFFFFPPESGIWKFLNRDLIWATDIGRSCGNTRSLTSWATVGTPLRLKLVKFLRRITWQSLPKLKMSVSFDLAAPLLGLYSVLICKIIYVPSYSEGTFLQESKCLKQCMSILRG